MSKHCKINERLDPCTATSYDEAIHLLKQYGNEMSQNFVETDGETVDIQHASNRVSKHEIICSEETPAFDTSAMDGYALNSDFVAKASELDPVLLCVQGTMLAGDSPITVPSDIEYGAGPCVEIATGAQFPNSTACNYKFDACVRYEDTISVPGPTKDKRYIMVVTRVKPNQNRRFAGSDFREGDVLVHSKSTIRPQHIMALASLGFDRLAVLKKPRVALWSTGSELQSYSNCESGGNRIRDVNGPYLSSALRELGVEVDFLGIVKDDASEFSRTVRTRLLDQRYDILITTGAVSKGPRDFIREGLKSLGADIQFHNVAVRPGHPILFATLSTTQPTSDGCHARSRTNEANIDSAAGQRVSFFGLPGNPTACAACLRFFVLPYLSFLLQQLPQTRFKAKLSACLPESEFLAHQVCLTSPNPINLETFRHGVMWHTAQGIEAALLKDQGSSKVKPLLAANCWIQIPRGHGETKPGDSFNCLPMYSGSLSGDSRF